MTEEPELGFIERYVSKELSVVEHPMAPGILGSPVHTHSHEDELSYVVFGTVQAQVGDRVVTAGPRDIIWKPRGIPHAFWNPGPERALVLELIMPGGFEGYFRELVALARVSNGPPDRARMQDIQSRYGLSMDLTSMAELMDRYDLRAPRM
jgi:mannose-6-phosphate isomerase-like protein (cupin superfamily)